MLRSLYIVVYLLLCTPEIIKNYRQYSQKILKLLIASIYLDLNVVYISQVMIVIIQPILFVFKQIYNDQLS